MGWHLLQTCSQSQGRVDRVVASLEAQAATAQRYTERVASGEKPRGRQPVALDAAHAGHLTCARRTAQALQYLTGELHTLLEVVVLRPTGVVARGTRQAELDALLDLLAEVRDQAAPGQQAHLRSLHITVTRALPAALAFVAGVERVQQDLHGVVWRCRAGADCVGLAAARELGTKHRGGGGRSAGGVAARRAGAAGDMGRGGTGE